MEESEAANMKVTRIEDLVVKLNAIVSGLKQDLAHLHRQLDTLDSNPELLCSLDVLLREDAELRANSLEAEVKQLREELKVIRELLGLNLGREVER
jgi:hypothetical protein